MDIQKPTERIIDKFLKAPDGTLLRYRHWPPTTYLDNKPTVLILPGRATAIEKVDNIIEQLRSRGYHVWALDWRGQGRSTREAGTRGYIKDYALYIADLDLFIRTFLKTDTQKRPLVVLGQSMGAHIGLRYMAEYPGVIAGAVMTAPMLDINTGGYSRKVAKWLCDMMVKLGLEKNYIYSQGDYNPVTQPFEGNVLTHNQEMFYYHRHLQIEHPDIVVGGVTFGWVKATIESIEYLNTPEMLGRIQVPVKIYAAEEEEVVDNSRIEKIVDWLPKSELEIIAGARHQLLSEVPEVEQRILNGFDRFVHQLFPGPVLGQERRAVIAVPDSEPPTGKRSSDAPQPLSTNPSSPTGEEPSISAAGQGAVMVSPQRDHAPSLTSSEDNDSGTPFTSTLAYS